MRKLGALLWGCAGAFAGLLSVWPSVAALRRRKLALVQLVVTEDPLFGLLAGWLGVWHGIRSRNRHAVLLGLAGVALRLRPWLKRGALSRQMADALRDGLGIGWQRAIPPEVHRAFAQHHRTDLVGPVRGILRLRVRETRDVLFAAPDGHALRLDIYEPRDRGDARPAILVLHGGAWFHGDKGLGGQRVRNRWLAAQGYVVFDAQYRLTGQWPAPLADVKCAIRWIKVNASYYGVDPARVAVMGRAAGAHLALLAAYTAGDARFAPSCFGGDTMDGVDDRVCAVIANAPPADLRLWVAERCSAIERLLGGLPGEIPDVYEQASPVTHVRAGVPPTLIIQGQRDRTVPPVHAELLANSLRAAGATVVTLRLPWGRHGVDGLPVGLSAPMILHDVDRFLAWAFNQGEREL